MRRVAILLVATGTGVLMWSVGSKLSSDAVGMAAGILFGLMAGIPAILLVLLAPQGIQQEYRSPATIDEQRKLAYSKGFDAGWRQGRTEAYVTLLENLPDPIMVRQIQRIYDHSNEEEGFVDGR